jgi:hypothetical protein
MKPGAAFTGTAITLEDGQRLDNLVLRLTRGSVVTGVVRYADGRPVRGAQVALTYFRKAPATGERTLTLFVDGRAMTDGRGVYRIFGVPPGDYQVLALLPFGMINLDLTTDADVQRAAGLAAQAGASSAVSPIPAPAPRRPTFGYAPVFYPGTPVASDAMTISLARGEERGGIDFQMRLESTARLIGIATGPDGEAVAGASVTVFAVTGGTEILGQFTRSDAQGQFSAAGLAPGLYNLEARSVPAPGAPGALLWGRQEVAVAGGDDVNVSVPMQPGVSVSGRLVFEPGAPPPVDLSRVRVSFIPERRGPPGRPSSAAATVNADGTFTAAGVVPGRHRIVVTVPPAASGAAPAWFVKSATANGADALDRFEIRHGEDVTGAVVTLTTRVSEISGAITDAAGRPAPEYFIIAFPADRALWSWNSRRIMQTRPSHDGHFEFRNLPPGEYLIGAVTDVEQNEWFEPAFLEQLLNASVKVTLADGEKKVQDLRLR